MVITGGGGIMQVSRGRGPGRSSAPYPGCLGSKRQPVIREDKLITFKYFFTRKLIFIRHSDPRAVSGGFGTMDEGRQRPR